ncbi:MAG TPA: hypothetical protein VFE88_04885 [Candidatus Nanoarchaeia archaeon]|nr:hypothetical protein [Candidatus Nanoarchaeia archaeon]
MGVNYKTQEVIGEAYARKFLEIADAIENAPYAVSRILGLYIGGNCTGNSSHSASSSSSTCSCNAAPISLEKKLE